MTNTNTNTQSPEPTTRFLPIDHHDGSPLAADDPRVPFARAVATAAVVLDELNADNAANSSPCNDWNAEAVGGHLVAVLERVAAVPSGRDLMEMPLVRDDLPLGELRDALATAAQAVHAAWTDAALSQTVTVPFGTLPGAAALAAYTSEVLTHTWDLATAIGVTPEWHQGDVEGAVAVIQMGLPAEPRGVEGMPFDPVVRVPNDAPAINRLVAWVGRNPGHDGPPA